MALCLCSYLHSTELFALIRCASCACSLAGIQKELQIPVIFKASFDKANRQDLSRYSNGS